MTRTDADLNDDLNARNERRDADKACVKAQRVAMTAKSLTIPCPTCGSHTGSQCFTLTGRRTFTTPHAARYRRANCAARV